MFFKKSQKSMETHLNTKMRYVRHKGWYKEAFFSVKFNYII